MMKFMLMLVLINTVYGFRPGMFAGRRKIGIVLPNDPYVFIEHELKLMCNLTTVVPETSASLFFTKANVVIPSQYIEVLSSRSIQLVLPIISPHDQGNYVCKLNKTGGGVQIVGNQIVQVEYEPKKVELISCEVYDWESMTCQWDLGVNYINLEHIDVQLVWTVRGLPQSDCPHITTNSCMWKAADGRNSFRSDMMYYMAVIVTNKKTGNSTTSDIFKEDTRKLVRPSSVSDLSTKHNSSCLKLEWHHKRHEAKLYRIQYQSKWQASWQIINLDDVNEKTICDLVPNTVYTVKIDCKPVWDGFWSEEVETTIKLDEDVPWGSPELQPGGFVEKPCSFPDCRVVTVYWRPIVERLTNGQITNYKVTSHDREMEEETLPIFTGSRTSGQLLLSAKKDYFIHIQGETRKGLSPHEATILIKSKDKKPPYPNNFVVEAERMHNGGEDLFRLHINWSEPSTQQKILGYTLFWCNGASSDHTCAEPLSWAVLKGEQKKYTMDVRKRNVLFGISMETMDSGETVSSGILWNDCIYMKNSKPEMAPKNVRALSLTEENSVRVEWDRYKCSETDGYITSYDVFYCTAQLEQNCSGKILLEEVDGRKTSLTFKDMSPETTYRVWVQARSMAGVSPESAAVYTTIPITGFVLSTEEIAGISIGVLFVVILGLVGFIFLFRRCAVKVKEQLKPYEIDLPRVPLPPIPMIKPIVKPPSLPSPDSDDEIYSKIHDHPPSPTSPDSMSLDMPLINHSDKSQGMSKKDSFLSRFSLGRQSIDSRESHYSGNKMMSTFRPKRDSPGLSSSTAVLDKNVSPYSCVDIVQCPNSEKIPRKHFPCNKTCHSVGSMVDDPAYERNNLSVLSNKASEKNGCSDGSGGSREHFNIKPLDRRKRNLRDNTLNSCESNERNSVVEIDDSAQDSSEIAEEKISSYVKEGMLGKTDSDAFIPVANGYIRDPSCHKCSNNNNIKMRNGYITTDSLNNPNIVVEDEEYTYRKELNKKPGQRPISEVINVPAHFYGSLSLLDSDGTATEL